MRALIVSSAFFASLLLTPAIAVAQSFDDVFAILSLPGGEGDSPGCGGCHILKGFVEPCPLFGTIQWGDTQEGVLDCLTRLGSHVQIVAMPAARRRPTGRLTVLFT